MTTNSEALDMRSHRHDVGPHPACFTRAVSYASRTSGTSCRLSKRDCGCCRGATGAARLQRISNAAASPSAQAEGEISKGEAAGSPAADGGGSGAVGNVNTETFTTMETVIGDVEELPPTFRQYYECASAPPRSFVLFRAPCPGRHITFDDSCGVHKTSSALTVSCQQVSRSNS